MDMGWDGRDGFLDHDYPFFEKFVCAKRPLSLYLLFFFFFFSKFSLSLILFHLFPSLFPIIPTPSAGVFGVHSFLLPSSLFFSFLLSGGGLLSLTHCMHLCNIPQTLPCHLSMYWQAGRQTSFDFSHSHLPPQVSGIVIRMQDYEWLLGAFTRCI